MSNVVTLHTVTTLDTPCEKVLTAAVGADLDDVVIVGARKDGSLYFASSTSDAGHVLWLFELAKKALLEIADET